MRKRVAALFDFDGTLTTRDTFGEFAVFYRGKLAFGLAMLRCLPFLVAYRLGIAEGGVAKEKLFSALYKGLSYESFACAGRHFAEHIDKIVKPETLEKLRRHKASGAQIVIVSASIREWVGPWCLGVGADIVLTTEIEVDDSGRLTGHFKTPNCHSEEKVRRLQAAGISPDDYELFAYGDSKGDSAMFAFAHHHELIR